MSKKTKVLITYQLNTSLEKNNSGGISKCLNNCINALKKRNLETFLISNNIKKNIYEPIPKLSLYRFIFLVFSNFIKSKKNESHTLLVYGCASIWPIIAILMGLIAGMKVFFHPSFHDPNYVVHKNKALLAKIIISLLSKLPFKKLKIICQTNHEYKLLRISEKRRLKAISVDFQDTLIEGEKTYKNFDSFKQRKNLICYVGRATKQKGWHEFTNIISKIPPSKNIVIITGKKYSVKLLSLKNKYKNLDIKYEISDNELYRIMKNTKIMFLASDYESLGIAHIEATLLGCYVPLIGRYPFWDEIKIDANNELKLLNNFINDDDNYDEIIKNKTIKFEYILNKNLPFLFENFINKLI